MREKQKQKQNPKLKQFRLTMIPAAMIFDRKFLEDKNGMET